ncbi:hypothetical protein CALCODRAFT_244034 [Calocera cornea HHB12733]|uniref:Uncharacterized protein n=1 Tax=Calocera cornea HHB12733 TaxID=1353952 RepID=A0A165GR46_9BASI|nr:hypothetical protein CALCODRAFT_244034 [Calocera cornea HHB12733]
MFLLEEDAPGYLRQLAQEQNSSSDRSEDGRRKVMNEERGRLMATRSKPTTLPDRRPVCLYVSSSKQAVWRARIVTSRLGVVALHPLHKLSLTGKLAQQYHRSCTIAEDQRSSFVASAFRRCRHAVAVSPLSAVPLFRNDGHLPAMHLAPTLWSALDRFHNPERKGIPSKAVCVLLMTGDAADPRVLEQRASVRLSGLVGNFGLCCTGPTMSSYYRGAEHVCSHWMTAVPPAQTCLARTDHISLLGATVQPHFAPG